MTVKEILDTAKEKMGKSCAVYERDMQALRTGRDFRANCQQQYHVLEILTSFEKSSREGKFIPLTTHYTRTAPMKNNPMHGILDD